VPGLPEGEASQVSGPDSGLRSAITATYEAGTARVRLTSHDRHGHVAAAWDGVCDFRDHRVYLTQRSERFGPGPDFLLLGGAEYVRDSAADTWVKARGRVAPLDPIAHVDRLRAAQSVDATSVGTSDSPPSFIVTFASGPRRVVWPKRPKHAEVNLDAAGRISRVGYVSRPAAVPSVEMRFEGFGTEMPVTAAPDATPIAGR
jgi:hypothetical protein